MNHEAWIEFRQEERLQFSNPLCWYCGAPCSGDTTVNIEVDIGLSGEVAICDNPDHCDPRAGL